eukprot:3634229-Pyramimonas_sp.AAC.1
MGRGGLLLHEAAELRIGNRSFNHSVDNPAGSLLWHAGRTRRLLKAPSAQFVTFDCCQFWNSAAEANLSCGLERSQPSVPEKALQWPPRPLFQDATAARYPDWPLR